MESTLFDQEAVADSRPARGPRPAGSRPSRRRRLRSFLLALSVLLTIVVGAAGAFRYVDMFWVYRGFPPPTSPNTVWVGVGPARHKVDVLHATVQDVNVTSADLGGWPDPCYVILPPGYDPSGSIRYPVLYLLHGTPGAPTNFLDVGDLLPTYDILLAEEQISPMIIVIPSGARSFLDDEEWANWVRPGNAWESFVANDLVSYVDSHYRTIASWQGRAIGGLSEGGYGALNIGFHHTDEFGMIESWSGYTQASYLPAIFGGSKSLEEYNSPGFELPVVAAQLKAHHTLIWSYDGKGDPLYGGNAAFASELARVGVDHVFLSPSGKHSWALWRGEMGASLEAASGWFGHVAH
ncbi:MAG TPA: alpha/beta hydrolase-fold protein [Acidimicrobiales bacterium]|nr:alpha/beta hydrolase-fold protein [Acidimicrobiales bacterium]